MKRSCSVPTLAMLSSSGLLKAFLGVIGIGLSLVTSSVARTHSPDLACLVAARSTIGRPKRLRRRSRIWSQGSLSRAPPCARLGRCALKLLDKIAIVTGAGSGVGQAISHLFAQEGATVVVSDIDGKAAKRVVEHIKEKGGKAVAMRTDVAQEKEVAALVEYAVQRFGRLDIMVNNAGVNSPVGWKEMTKDEWDRVMDINLWGVFLGCRAAALAMLKQRSGKITNISSVVAKTGSIFSGMNYSASKAGVSCLTINFAKVLAPYGINVNGIAPGTLDTPFQKTLTKEQKEAIIKSIPIPLGTLGRAQDVAEAALFLASDSARIITGEIVDVNAGVFMD